MTRSIILGMYTSISNTNWLKRYHNSTMLFIHDCMLMPLYSHHHPERWIPDNFQAAPENSSLPSSLDLILKKTHLLSFLTFALFPLTSLCLARICSEHGLEICITSTSCAGLPLYNISLIVFLYCKSLWIKPSAKWIYVNVNSLKYNWFTLFFVGFVNVVYTNT